MIPYRVKHKISGLYYKPGRPNLSTIGKVYGTGNNCLNYLKDKDFLYIYVTGGIITKFERLGYQPSAIEASLNRMEIELKIPKTEFEIEYVI